MPPPPLTRAAVDRLLAARENSVRAELNAEVKRLNKKVRELSKALKERPAGGVSRADVKRFLEVFRGLESFEAQERYLRGYGAFGPTVSLPVPEAQRTANWLAQLAGV